MAKLINILVVLLCLFAFGLPKHDELKKCLKERCPDQYDKCLKAKGCEDKLDKCADKCGVKLNQTCWTLCLGLPGAAANVCICAVNQACIDNMTLLDRIALQAMQAVGNDNLRSQ